jgi:hypothetical protein
MSGIIFCAQNYLCVGIVQLCNLFNLFIFTFRYLNNLELQGAGLFYHYDSHISALLDTYPEIGLIPINFNNIPSIPLSSYSFY